MGKFSLLLLGIASSIAVHMVILSLPGVPLDPARERERSVSLDLSLPPGPPPALGELTKNQDKGHTETSKVVRSDPLPAAEQPSFQPMPQAPSPSGAKPPDKSATPPPRPPQGPASLSPPQTASTRDKQPGALEGFENLFTSPGKLGAAVATNRSSDDRGTDASPSSNSAFNRYLLNHIAQNQYHDRQFDFGGLIETREVVLRLYLNSSGILVRAEIEKSSGDAALDAAAMRSSLAASPFKAPPKEDRASGYVYRIPIRYVPVSNNRSDNQNAADRAAR